ncbi:hypothetical protein RJ40_01535 [Methanofollis aquaemaris]|uniref:Uncharacterized protein n=1 Tax=Methanofollis aquaemaris TaxID=126734 RepID=A0A8A3S2B7_9EURY|nr:hypothetical protein RJ40_01535 [Methanofollis aquaemaris]
MKIQVPALSAAAHPTETSVLHPEDASGHIQGDVDGATPGEDERWVPPPERIGWEMDVTVFKIEDLLIGEGIESSLIFEVHDTVRSNSIQRSQDATVQNH